MDTIEYQGVTISYSVTRKRNKNLYARMDKSGNVIVTAPFLTSKRTIEKFVGESYFKLIKKIQKHSKSIVSNGEITVLGEKYSVSDIENLNYLLMSKLKEYINENYLNICSRLGVKQVPSVRFKRVKGYLGEYNKKKNVINLNILIAHLDKNCVEYVIIHELCHIKHLNHQKEFWQEVSNCCPDYLNLRRKCKKEFVYYENY